MAVFLCLCSPLLCSPLPCSTSPFLPYILGRIHLSTARAAHRRSVTIHRLSDLCRSSPLSRSDLLCDRSTTPTSGLRGTNTNTHRAVEADIRSPNTGSQKPEARSQKQERNAGYCCSLIFLSASHKCRRLNPPSQRMTQPGSKTRSSPSVGAHDGCSC